MSKENLKKYQKKKFENYKKINELNINDNEAYITMKVNSLNDVYSKFSIIDDEILSDEFTSVLAKKASFISLDYPLVLEIFGDSFNSEEKILLRKRIKNHFSLVAINKETELKALKRKSRFFLLIGIVFFAIFIIMSKIERVFAIQELISFIGSFSIWEWAELTIFEQDSLKEEILLNKHLSKIRVLFNKDS